MPARTGEAYLTGLPEQAAEILSSRLRFYAATKSDKLSGAVYQLE